MITGNISGTTKAVVILNLAYCKLYIYTGISQFQVSAARVSHCSSLENLCIFACSAAFRGILLYLNLTFGN